MTPPAIRTRLAGLAAASALAALSLPTAATAQSYYSRQKLATTGTAAKAPQKPAGSFTCGGTGAMRSLIQGNQTPYVIYTFVDVFSEASALEKCSAQKATKATAFCGWSKNSSRAWLYTHDQALIGPGYSDEPKYACTPN